MEKKLTEKQKAALKKGREALKKKQASAKKAVRKELSKTKKSVKKATSKIMATAKKKATKVASKKMDSLKNRLHKRGLAGEHNAYEIYLMLENNDGNWYNALWKSLETKAKRGSELSVDKLADSETVKRKARSYRKLLNDSRFDNGMEITTLADEKEGRKLFAASIITLVLESVTQ